MRWVTSLWKGRMLVPSDAPSAAQIIAQAARDHGLSPEDLRNGDKSRKYAWPRADAAWRLRQDCRSDGRPLRSYPRIASLLGMKDHTSAAHLVRRWPVIRELMLEGAR